MEQNNQPQQAVTDEREEFEKAAPRHGINLERFEKHPDRYKYAHTEALFKLWKEAWAAALLAKAQQPVAASADLRKLLIAIEADANETEQRRAIARAALQQAEQEPQPVAIADKQIDDAVFALGIQGYAYVDDPAGYRALVCQFAAPAKPAEQEKIIRLLRRARNHIMDWWRPEGSLPPAKSPQLVEDIDAVLAEAEQQAPDQIAVKQPSNKPAGEQAPAGEVPKFTMLIDELISSWQVKGNAREACERRIKARANLESAIAALSTPPAVPSLLMSETVEQAALESGLKRMHSCCDVPGKFCSSDVWQGELRAYSIALLRLLSAAPAAPGGEQPE